MALHKKAVKNLNFKRLLLKNWFAHKILLMIVSMVVHRKNYRKQNMKKKQHLFSEGYLKNKCQT